MIKVRYIDLFCGIGGFRLGVEKVAPEYSLHPECVFSSDIDPYARQAYAANFGETPTGDITKVPATAIPDHDLLLGGFPCQPFSIIGKGKGFADTRGTLFFEIARILEAKRPKAFILENVKQLRSHRQGRTLARILEALNSLGYAVDTRVLNALHYGLPHKRERLFIVGYHKAALFEWPAPCKEFAPLSSILQANVPKTFYASPAIARKRNATHKPKSIPSIWHENKSGHISSYPYSCALRAGASYNYLLVNGERRLTPREMLRLQGFPDTFQIVVSDAQVRKQAGNAVPTNLVAAAAHVILPYIAQEKLPRVRNFVARGTRLSSLIFNIDRNQRIGLADVCG